MNSGWIIFFLLAGASLYLGASITYLCGARYGMAIVFLCYSVSNLAFLWDTLSH